MSIALAANSNLARMNAADAAEGALHDGRGAAQGRLHRQDVLLRHEAGRGQDAGGGRGLVAVQERCEQV